MPDTEWEHYMTKRPLPTYAEKLKEIEDINGTENIEILDNTLTVSLTSEDLISNVVTILENNIKSFEIFSLPEAIFFHKKYKFNKRK